MAQNRIGEWRVIETRFRHALLHEYANPHSLFVVVGNFSKHHPTLPIDRIVETLSEYRSKANYSSWLRKEEEERGLREEKG